MSLLTAYVFVAIELFEVKILFSFFKKCLQRKTERAARYCVLQCTDLTAHTLSGT